MTSKQFKNWEKNKTKSSDRWGEKIKAAEFAGITTSIGGLFCTKAVEAAIATSVGVGGALIFLGASYVERYYKTLDQITTGLEGGVASFTLVKTITTVTVYNEAASGIWEEAYLYDISSLHFQAETPDSELIPITPSIWNNLINNSERGTPYEPI